MADLALYVGKEVQSPQILTTDGEAPARVWSIGRTLENDIVLAIPQVSGHHARIRFDEELGAWQLCDACSTNGTLFNGRPLDPFRWVAITDSDQAVLGAVEARIIFSTRIDDTLRKRRQLETEARLQPLTQEEWRDWQPQSPPATRGPYEATLGRLVDWIASADSVLGGVYRLLVLVVIVAGVVAFLILLGE